MPHNRLQILFDLLNLFALFFRLFELRMQKLLALQFHQRPQLSNRLKEQVSSQAHVRSLFAKSVDVVCFIENDD